MLSTMNEVFCIPVPGEEWKTYSLSLPPPVAGIAYGSSPSPSPLMPVAACVIWLEQRRKSHAEISMSLDHDMQVDVVWWVWDSGGIGTGSG